MDRLCSTHEDDNKTFLSERVLKESLGTVDIDVDSNVSMLM
jgi:hypothetical protein